MFKKIATSFVAVVMALSAFSFTSFADSYDYTYTLETGTTATIDTTSGTKYIKVKVPEVTSSQYVSNLQLNLEFTNVDTSMFNVNRRLDTNKAVKYGLWYWGENDDGDEVKKYHTKSTFNQATFSGNTLKLLWADTTRGWTTDDGTLFEVAVKPLDASKDMTIKFADGTTFSTCKSDASGVVGANIDLTKEYVIKANSSTVVEKTAGPTIDSTEVASDDNGKFAKGFGAKFADVTAGSKVNVKWTLTNTSTEATDSKTIEYDTEGITGNVAVGLVIKADTNVFENITAAAEIVE